MLLKFVGKTLFVGKFYAFTRAPDSDIEQLVNYCKSCVRERPEPEKAVLISCEKSKYFFDRIHADFCGPVKEKMILIVTDTYSKWPEAFIMNSTDSQSTVEKFRECFARFGLPRVVVTDNGRQFTSDEFTKFLTNNGIKHLTSSPYHPASNGCAENAVKSLKSAIYKASHDECNRYTSLETLINRYVFHYRNSIHVASGCAPSSLVFKSKIKTRLDLLKQFNSNYQDSQVQNARGSRNVSFEIGQKVFCRDYRNPNKKAWVEAVVDKS